MKHAFLIVLGLVAAPPTPGQVYHLRNGTVLAAEDVVVRGTRLVERIDAADADTTVERLHLVADVVRIEAPEPEALIQARLSLVTGEAAEAIRLCGPLRAEWVLFAKVPGSWWTEASRVRLRGLLREKELKLAEAAAREIIATSLDPEVIGLARLGLAEVQILAGNREIVSAMIDAILAKEVPPAVRAYSWLLRGELALVEGDSEAALEAFLRIPVLHGTRVDLLPSALAGSVRAYRMRDEHGRADRATAELIRIFPESHEAMALAKDPSDLSPSL